MLPHRQNGRAMCDSHFSQMKPAIHFLAVLAFSGVSLAEVTFEAWSVTERSLFPSAIISTATVDWNGDLETAEDKKTRNDPGLEEGLVPVFGDENGWLGVSVFDLPKGSKLTVEVAVDGFMKPSRWSGVVERAHEELRVFPKASWDYAALQAVREQRPVNATFKITVNGEAHEEQTEVCLVKSVNDCPFFVLYDEEGEEYDDLSWLFAAYVNENHPWIDGILKEALQSGLVSSFSGYQSGDPDEVIAQVFAVWNVLQRRGIKYSDVSTTTPSKFVFSQTVRFLDDTVEATQANCVDGTVLMASILRKIGIDAYLVLVPGHCFLAFRLSSAEAAHEDLFGEDSDLVGLETTMLGNASLKPVKDLPKMPGKLKNKEFATSIKTFEAALGAGSGALADHAEALLDESQPTTKLISIKEAREFGIMPIASGKARK